MPSGAQELLCVLQDRRFDATNQLVYSTTMMDMETGFLGNRVLVNGQPQPDWSLATRAYRVRVLNGSNARVYKLAWSDGTPITALGGDGGLLERPRAQKFVTLGPAQRVDVWLDLSGRTVGTKLELRSEAFELSDAGLAMGMMGMGRGMGRGMGGGRGGVMAGSSGELPLGAPVSLLSITVARKEDLDGAAADTPQHLRRVLATRDRAPGPADSHYVPDDGMEDGRTGVRHERRRGR